MSGAAPAVCTPDDVLAFWFEPGCARDLPAMAASIERWFKGNATLDDAIRDRFGATLDAARLGRLQGWKDAPRSCLALVIVLDQFSRNVFRATPAAYAQDPQGLAAFEHALRHGWLDAYTPVERLFALMPVVHSEDLAVHVRHARQFEALRDASPAALRGAFDFAVTRAASQRLEIERFGRHPRRNVVLGRVSTAAEESYLASLPEVTLPFAA